MTSSLSSVSGHSRSYANMVTQLYTFSSWTRSKSFSNGSSGMPYVGFPGLTLTPIPENPLLDSMLQDDCVDSREHDKWLEEDADNHWNPSALKNGSLPQHWVTTTAKPTLVSEAAKDCNASSSNACAVDLSSKQSFLPKDEDERGCRRSRLVKLLLFALCAIVILAGIVLWIFSPAFA
ncbi:uncharacterized protein LOC143292416 [Babylonia areolata]|uniref:uncharacterized protein LOC143292416 n=1 Tax=Babylonia areolata TaxID=304850 RepID=UPI003FCF604E